MRMARDRSVWRTLGMRMSSGRLSIDIVMMIGLILNIYEAVFTQLNKQAKSKCW